MNKAELKFFTFRQNNSGGYFIIDDKIGIALWMIIQAKDAAQAWRFLDGISFERPDFHEYCSCCGERWSEYLEEKAGTIEPMIRDEPAQEYLNRRGPAYLGIKNSAWVRYADGTRKEIIGRKVVGVA